MELVTDLKLLGKCRFDDVEINHIEGGFGEGKKCILAIDIAEVHGMELREVNQSIKRLMSRGRINENVHYIDLLEDKFKITVSDLEISVGNRTKNIFLLSERGYYSLVKYMDDDKSWEVHDKLVDDYFQLKNFKENVQKELDTKGYYDRLDELKFKFSEKRTIKTFSNCNVMELPKLMEEFKEYLGTIKNTMENGEITYASEVKKARYDSMLKGLERLRVTLDIGLSHHLLEKYIQPLTRDKHKLENKKNGGNKTAQTKEIKKLQKQIKELVAPSIDEYFTVPIHGFSHNKQYESLTPNKWIKTKEYKAFCDYFPYFILPKEEELDVDLDKPLKMYLAFDHMAKFDTQNLSKSAIDLIMGFYGRNDNNIRELDIKCNNIVKTYRDGKIYFLFKNI